MSGTQRRFGDQDALTEFDGHRRTPNLAADHVAEHAPALTGPADPRLAHSGASASGLMNLQRSAGNAAVMSLIAERPPVQRAVRIEEMEVSAAAPQPTAQQEEAAYGTAAPVTSDGGTTTIHGSHVSIEAPMTEAHGVLRADTIIADSVVASSYTPGAGNVW
jgi:hypothetical protein